MSLNVFRNSRRGFSTFIVQIEHLPQQVKKSYRTTRQDQHGQVIAHLPVEQTQHHASPEAKHREQQECHINIKSCLRFHRFVCVNKKKKSRPLSGGQNLFDKTNVNKDFRFSKFTAFFAKTRKIPIPFGRCPARTPPALPAETADVIEIAGLRTIPVGITIRKTAVLRYRESFGQAVSAAAAFFRNCFSQRDSDAWYSSQ